MEILEEVMENRHTKLVTKDINNSRASESCEFLNRIQKCNNCNEHNEGKQNIGFGAALPTTMQPTKTEIKIAPTETCAAVVDVEIPLDVPELRIATDEGDANPESTTDGCKVVKNLNKDKFVDEDDNDVLHDHQPNDEPSQESSPLAAEDENDDDLDNSDDESTTDSDFSDMSDGSSESGREWKPIKPINWVQKQIHSGADPRELLSQMLPNSGPLAPGLNDITLWRILASMLAEPPRRQKLRTVNTFADVIQLVRESKNVIVLTGAGVSVSCGIPDFRSSDGIYSRLAKDFPDLPDPQAMFDINYFSRDPRPFYKFAREIYPGQFKPSPCHSFIKLLERKQKLLRNYTQNIDTLEQVAGIQNVIECHGSFSTASCTKCKFKTTADVIRADIFAQRIPVCPHCQPNIKQSACASEPVSEVQLREIVENGIMKPDIVFFGEGLPEKFHNVMAEDKDKCDLLIVIGSSLKVRPVALIPSSIPAHVPQILINREQLHHLEFDVELLGDSDVIINQLCHHLGGEWKQICFDDKVLCESAELLPREEVSSCNEEDDVQHQYRLDNDTQSVKSNASTDIAIRSSGGYSDSGFESSTSSVVVGSKPALASVASDADAEATNSSKNIQSNSLSLSDTKTICNIKCNKDLLSPVLLDDNMDASASFEHTTFQTFHPAATGNCRHLSIDSSKDSGIQCNDSPNSAAPIGPLLPPSSYFSDTGGKVMPPDLPESSVSATVAPAKDLPAITQQDNCVSTAHSVNGCKITHERKRVTAADRLIEGTYYCHETSASYVFPGAQVFWFTDSSEDEEDIDEEIDFVDEEEEDDEEEEEEEEDEDFDIEEEDTLQAISPILPPAIEAEVVAEITTHCGGMNAPKKRNANEHSNEDNSMRKNKRNDSLLHGDNTTTSIALSSSPPTKRRCDDNDAEQTLVTTTTISSTTPTNGNLQVALLETKTTPSAPEALLQQL